MYVTLYCSVLWMCGDKEKVYILSILVMSLSIILSEVNGRTMRRVNLHNYIWYNYMGSEFY